MLFGDKKKYQFYAVRLLYVAIFQCQFVECDGYKSIILYYNDQTYFFVIKNEKNGAKCPKSNIFRKSLILSFQHGGHLGFGG